MRLSYCYTYWLGHVVIVLLLDKIAVFGSRQIYVSQQGNDTKGCGTSMSRACRTIAYAVARSDGNDVIELEPADEPYAVATPSGDVVNITHTLMIRPVGGGRAKLTCAEGRTSMLAVFDPDADRPSGSVAVTLTLENVELSGCSGDWHQPGVMGIANAGLKIHNCSLASPANIVHGRPTSCDVVAVSVVGSTFDRCGYVKPHVPCVDLSGCHVTSMTVVDTTFRQAAVRLDADATMSLTMTNTTLLGLTVRGSMLEIDLAWNGSTVSLNDMRVIGHVSKSSPVLIRVTERTASTSLRFTNVTFTDNVFTKTLGGALALVGQLTSSGRQTTSSLNVRFTDCTFSGNSARDAGGALYVVGVDGVTINRCTFSGNSAGYGGAILVAGSTNVALHNSTFVRNRANHQNGTGGAIYSVRSDVTVTGCRFEANEAAFGGRSIHATDLIHADVTVNAFVTDPDEKPVAAATSHLYLEEGRRRSVGRNDQPTVRLQANTFVDNSTAAGRRGVYDVRIRAQPDADQNTVCCPAGHFISELSESAYDLPGFDTGNSIRYVSCTPCPEGTYNLRPRCSEKNDAEKNGNVCLKCPQRARCPGDGKILTPRNYWALPERNGKNKLTFLLCPAGYCAPDLCRGIQCCAENRTGLLCGGCRQGNSFRLDSDSCQATSDCRATSALSPALWAALSGLVYGTLIGLVLFAAHSTRKRGTAELSGDSTVDDYWTRRLPARVNDDQGARAGHSDQRSSQTTTDDRPDDFEPSLVRAAEENRRHSEVDHLLSALNEETQTSGQDSLKLATTTKLNMVTEVPYVLCGFWMLAQLLEDVYWPSYDISFQTTIIANMMDLINLRPIYYRLMALCTSGGVAAVMKPWLTLITVGTMFVILLPILIVVSVCQLAAVSRRWACFTDVLWKLFLVLVVLAYLPVLKACLQLVHCVQLQPDAPQALFINGTIPCYQWWQWLTVVFLLTHIIPLGLMIWMSLPLVRSQLVSRLQFVAGAACPLGVIVYWTCRHCHLVCGWLFPERSYFHTMQFEASRDCLHAMEGIHSFFMQPFTVSLKSTSDGRRVWIIFMFARALLLASISIMLNQMPHIKTGIMIMLLSAVMIIHAHWQPYRTRRINCLETTMLGILIFLAVLGMTNSFAYMVGLDSDQYIYHFGYVSNFIFIIITSFVLASFLIAVIYDLRKALTESKNTA